MYLSYYGFLEKPFALSPDPRFLYLSDSHREVLGHLVYGIEQGEGFMAITGEVGTGKTTLCRTLLSRLGAESEVAFLFNPTLTPLELLKAINAEFGLSTFGESRPELTEVLNGFLLEQSAQGRRVLLIVDEAQNLETETLEQLRLLSNLETETTKLLQIVLLGQPELDEKLAQTEMRQLRQRISVWWHLGPLEAKETAAYVRHRLRIAGALDRPIFTEGGLKAVHQLSRGVPRVINLVCDRALLAGYAEQQAQIDRKLVSRTATELRPARSRRASSRWAFGGRAGALAFATGIALAIALAGAMRQPGSPPPEPPAVSAAPPAAPAPLVTPDAPAPAPVEIARPEPPAPRVPLQGVALERLLRTQTPGAARSATLDAILAAWELPPSESEPIEEEDLRARLAAQRLELLPVRPELAALLDAATPAIVSLRDRAGVARIALLRSVVGDRVELEGVVRGESVSIESAELLQHLDGEVYAVWRDHEDLPRVIRPGDQGRPVVWLQQVLGELGYYRETAHGSFDERTRDAVSRFQWDRSIEVDGAVGPRTQMSLYDALPRYTTPSLLPESVNLARASS